MRLSILALCLAASAAWALPSGYEPEFEYDASVRLPSERIVRHGRLVVAQPVGARGGAWRLSMTRQLFFDEVEDDRSHRLPEEVSVTLLDTLKAYGIVTTQEAGYAEVGILDHVRVEIGAGQWIFDTETGGRWVHEIDVWEGRYRLLSHPDRKAVYRSVSEVRPYRRAKKSCWWNLLPWWLGGESR